MGAARWAKIPRRKCSREPHQVHGDIDFELAAEFRDLAIREGTDIDEPVHRGGYAIGHLVLVRAEREAEDFEFAVVVPFEQIDHLDADRVLVKVGGKIADANFVALRPAGNRRYVGRCRIAVAHVDLRGFLLERGRIP